MHTIQTCVLIERQMMTGFRQCCWGSKCRSPLLRPPHTHGFEHLTVHSPISEIIKAANSPGRKQWLNAEYSDYYILFHVLSRNFISYLAGSFKTASSDLFTAHAVHWGRRRNSLLIPPCSCSTTGVTAKADYLGQENVFPKELKYSHSAWCFSFSLSLTFQCFVTN